MLPRAPFLLLIALAGPVLASGNDEPAWLEIVTPSEDEVVIVHWLLRGDDESWNLRNAALGVDHAIEAPVRFDDSGPTYVGPLGAAVEITVAVDRPVQRVSFWIDMPSGDTRFPCADDTEAPYRCHWSASTETPGEYALHAAATDADGERAEDTRTVTLWWSPAQGDIEPR